MKGFFQEKKIMQQIYIIESKRKIEAIESHLINLENIKNVHACLDTVVFHRLDQIPLQSVILFCKSYCCNPTSTLSNRRTITPRHLGICYMGIKWPESYLLGLVLVGGCYLGHSARVTL